MVIKKTLCVWLFAFFLAGCLDYGREVQEVKSQLEEKQAQIEECRRLAGEVAAMKQRVERVYLAGQAVFDRLDRLDQNRYQGRYVAVLREKKASTDAIVAGYQALIDRLEKDLAGSAGK